MPRAGGSQESSYALYGGTPRCCSPTFGICRAHRDSRHEVFYEPRSYRRIGWIADRRAVDIEGYSLLEVIARLEAFSSLALRFLSSTYTRHTGPSFVFVEAKHSVIFRQGRLLVSPQAPFLGDLRCRIALTCTSTYPATARLSAWNNALRERISTCKA